MSKSSLENNPSQVTLSCNDIGKSFLLGSEPLNILSNFNLELNSGEICMVFGPSGSGKSTLLKICGAILEPSSGSCEILGKNIYKMSSADRVKFRANNLGFIFQQYNLFPSLNAVENIAMPLIVAGTPWDEAIEKARDMMKQVELERHMNSKLTTLSGGQLQRIAIARAIIRAPSLIICDEPTSSLDLATARTIIALIKSCIKKSNSAILIATHDHSYLDDADKVIHLDQL